MAKQSIVVELDDGTIRSLAVLGKPNEVLARLADAAVEAVYRPDHQHRAQTDESLRIERDKADDRAADALEPSGERAAAKAMIARQRAERRRHVVGILARERKATDEDLTGERAHVDTLLVDQREANAQMVSAAIHAQEMADAADAAMERAEESTRELRRVAEFRELFMGILGHDLRNPLAAIITSAAALLRRGHLDENDAKKAALIIRSGQRMSRMISQMLDFTRARLGGGFPLELEPTDLGDVCRSVVEEFETTIHLEVEGDVTGTWDHDRLVEVLSNLAGNAIEHAARGTVVRIKAHADETKVIVEVSNQGDDIPANVHPFIFEPFHRAKQHEKSATGNLGLGLYIAREIVVSHGGTLEARSAGGTTTFVMCLPRRSPAC